MADEKMITTRGLIDSDVGPLRRFTGILDSMPEETTVYNEGEANERKGTRVTLNNKDIEVLEAVEPYQFPIYSIVLSLSNRKKSMCGVLSEGAPVQKEVGFNNVADHQYAAEQLDSANPAYVKPKDRMDIKQCIGKRLGYVMCDAEEGRPAKPLLYDGRADKDVERPCWTVYSIEGVGIAGGQGMSPMDKAMTLLDGKSLAEFNAAALADPQVRGDAALLQAISKPVSAPDSFANTMMTAGKFTKDEQEVYHKV